MQRDYIINALREFKEGKMGMPEILMCVDAYSEASNGAKQPVSRHYIIVSFKHGHNGNLCFWRPNNAGYTNDLQQAGRYTEQQVKDNMSYYHNGENVAIEENKLLSDFKMRIHLDTNYLKVRKYKKLAERGLLSLNCT